MNRDPRTGKPKAGQPCKTCAHRKRALIESAWIGKTEPRTRLAERHGLTIDSVQRHMAAHVDDLRKAEILHALKTERAAAVVDELRGDVTELNAALGRIFHEIEVILQRAKNSEDDQLALVALRDMRATLRDIAKLAGLMGTTLNVTHSIADSPQWAILRRVLVEVFEEHPPAGIAFCTKTKNLGLGGRAELLPALPSS